MQIRLGYELVYQFPQPTPMIVTLNVHHTRASDLVRPDQMHTDPWVPTSMYRDGFGNWCTRLVAAAGHFRLTTDALINDRGTVEPPVPVALQHPVESLPEETLVFLLPSRFCESDLLAETAWRLSARRRPAGRGCRPFATSCTTTSALATSTPVPRKAPGRSTTSAGVCAAITLIWRLPCAAA